MPPRPVTAFSVVVLAALWVGCATYTMDLDRARRHYQETQFEQALALFRVLEHDLDSFTPAERTQYAYLRGMTDYRLSSGSSKGSDDTQQAFRSNARYWLGLSAAMEKRAPGSITEEERGRLQEALEDLNRDVHGGVAAPAQTPEGEPPSPTDPTNTPPPETTSPLPGG
jgi:hypothetical protein